MKDKDEITECKNKNTFKITIDNNNNNNNKNVDITKLNEDNVNNINNNNIINNIKHINTCPMHNNNNNNNYLHQQLTKQHNYVDLTPKEIELIEKGTSTKIMDHLGYGGFSIVKFVVAQKTNRKFALKIINLNNNRKFKKKSMEKRVEFVNQEISANINLHHKNIVKLYNYYKVDGFITLLTEFMSNKDLKHFIKRFLLEHGFISEALAAFFILEIIDGLLYLKRCKVIHRDIKPENIMVDSDYTAKIGDFSLSRTIDLTKPYLTSRSGTLPYLPPESLKAKAMRLKPSLVNKLDVFSLGILVYFMIFNEHPLQFKNNISFEDYSKKFKEITPSYIGSRNQTISPVCRKLLEGMLQKNINKRFSLEQINSHEWVRKMRIIVSEMKDIYNNNSEKIILELNKLDLERVNFNSLSLQSSTMKVENHSNFLSKKRDRSVDSKERNKEEKNFIR